MFDHKHYVPILKGKAGEYASLAEITSQCKAGLTPLLELMFEDKDRGKIEKECKKLKDNWADPRPFFADVYREATDDGGSAAVPLRQFLDCARKNQFPLIPVTGLGRASVYQDVVREASLKDKKGICLRLEPNDFGDMDLLKPISDFIGLIEQTESNIDLIIDLKEIPLTQVPVFQMLAVTILSSVPNLMKWRTLTLAATTFPITMGTFQSGTSTIRVRGEWTIWNLIKSNKSLKRIPTFGDYAIANPVITDFDPRVMDMTANIRYTIDGNWLVIKGRGVKKAGYAQFGAICKALVKRPEFCGAAFSEGDDYIDRCAAGNATTGNMTTWRRVGTTHHLTFVVDRLARIIWP